MNFYNNINKSSPKSFQNSASPHSRECSRPLHTCATRCSVHTADKSNHSAVDILHPQCSATCIL